VWLPGDMSGGPDHNRLRPDAYEFSGRCQLPAVAAL